MTHQESIVKRANWAPKLNVLIFVDLGLKPLVSFGQIVLEYSQEVFTILVGPTLSTHHSSARGGGPRGSSPSFFPLFWVAKSLNSPPKTCPILIKPKVSNTLTNMGVVR
jgi:hypothetical protein